MTGSGPTVYLGSTTIVLHWLAAAGLIGMIVLGLYVSGLPRGPDKTAVIQIHKSLGMIVLVLLLARLWWRLRQGFPAPASPLSPLESRLAHGVHWGLLIIPILMVASGIARSLAYARGVDVFGLPVLPALLTERNDGLNEIAGAIHDGLAVMLIGLIGLHVAGALRHHLIKRDDTLRRMLGLSPARTTSERPHA